MTGFESDQKSRHETVLREFDPSLASQLTDHMKHANIRIIAQTGGVTKVAKEADGSLKVKATTSVV